MPAALTWHSEEMSWTPALPPSCTDEALGVLVELVISARKRDVGDVVVGRVLPAPLRRMVGPFIFLDEMGPVDLPHGVNVPPHPHINLATVTYLFEGELVHRDSLGTEQTIRPGAINWMTAGRGIVHSERSPAEHQARGARLHGVQLWCALPAAHEERAPEFAHYAAEAIPIVERPGLAIRVLAGEAYGARSPVATLSPLFYLDVRAAEAAELEVTDAYTERAAYVVDGRVRCDSQIYERGTMIVFSQERHIRVALAAGTRVVLLGGEPLDGPRHIYWNFVSSSLERIDRAKQDWLARRFPTVPGDETEFVPLPDREKR